MNPLDILIIIIFCYSMVLGFFRGLIREITAIAGVIAGFYCAYTWYAEGAKFLGRWLSDPVYLNILGFLLIFFSVNTLAWIIGILIRWLFHETFGKWSDRISGLIFAVIKSTLIVSVLLTVLVAFLPANTAVLKNSVLAPYVTRVSEKMADMIPNEMKKEFAKKFRDLRETWKKAGEETLKEKT